MYFWVQILSIICEFENNFFVGFVGKLELCCCCRGRGKLGALLLLCCCCCRCRGELQLCCCRGIVGAKELQLNCCCCRGIWQEVQLLLLQRYRESWCLCSWQRYRYKLGDVRRCECKRQNLWEGGGKWSIVSGAQKMYLFRHHHLLKLLISKLLLLLSSSL